MFFKFLKEFLNKFRNFVRSDYTFKEELLNIYDFEKNKQTASIGFVINIT